MTRRGRRIAKLAACGIALGLLTTGCGSSDDSSTVALAFVGPLTGESANLGINAYNAAKLAVKQANDANPSVKIELKEFDTTGNPAVATTVKDRYINDNKIVGVIGPIFSGETKAVLPDLQQNGLVMISPSATNVELPTKVVKDQTVFHRVIPDDDVQGKGVADYIAKKLKPAKVAYIHDNSDYGKGLAEGTRKLVEAAGVATATEDAVDPTSQDFSAAVNKVKGSGADLVFYGGYYEQAGRFRKQLVDAGVKAGFLSGDGALDPGFVAAAGAAGEGAQITCPCNLATTDAAGPLGDFAKAYKAYNGKDPGTYSTEAYDATNILLEGIKAGDTTRDKLLSYVEHLGTYNGISKQIAFEDNGNVKSNGVFFFEVRSGKLALLGSSDTLLK